jgi:hypothetical protein
MQQNDFSALAIPVGTLDPTAGGYTQLPLNQYTPFIQNFKALAPQYQIYCYVTTSNAALFANSGQAAMIAFIQSLLAAGFDGYINDDEAFYPDPTDYIAFSHQFAAACHAANKVSGAYFGIDPPFTNEDQCLPTFTDQDFVVPRFSPLATTAAETLANIEAICPVIWLPQMRTESANNEGETMEGDIAFYTAQFGSKLPAGFGGFSFWALDASVPADFTAWEQSSLINIIPPTQETWTLTISAGPGGTVSPTGTVAVPSGQSETVTANANAGNSLSNWLFDGVAYVGNPVVVGAQQEGTSHTLQAVFTASPIQKPGTNKYITAAIIIGLTSGAGMMVL